MNLSTFIAYPSPGPSHDQLSPGGVNDVFSLCPVTRGATEPCKSAQSPLLQLLPRTSQSPPLSTRPGQECSFQSLCSWVSHCLEPHAGLWRPSLSAALPHLNHHHLSVQATGPLLPGTFTLFHVRLQESRDGGSCSLLPSQLTM
jgi:hypothetical protein